MKTLFKLLLIVIVVFNPQNILSQNESGTRYLNQPVFQANGIWADSSVLMFQEQFPIIRRIPPLSTEMPYNVLVGYIYLDSLLRFGEQSDITTLLESWR